MPELFYQSFDIYELVENKHNRLYVYESGRHVS